MHRLIGINPVQLFGRTALSERARVQRTFASPFSLGRLCAATTTNSVRHRSTPLDKVFAVRIGVFFRGNPARELAVIHEALRPGGSLYLFYDPFAANQVKAVTERQSALLSSHGFSLTHVLTKELAQTRVIGIIARK